MSSKAQSARGTNKISKHVVVHQANEPTVTICLSDVNIEETLPERIISLDSTNQWTAEIGRGSLNDDTVVPNPSNAWFTSKVMSRQHATLKAYPDQTLVMVKDSGSMHGTFLNGSKLTDQYVEVIEDDILTFGTEIVRNADTFLPLKTLVTYEWSFAGKEESNQTYKSNNTFTADYSEEDVYSDFDDDVEFIHESVRQPSVEIIVSTNLFTDSSAKTSPSTRSDQHTTSSMSDTMNSDDAAAKDDESVPHATESKQINQVLLEDFMDSDDEVDVEYAPEVEYSEDYSDDGEPDEEGSEDDQVLEVTQVKSTLTVPEEKPAREPSPSDAAMAKSTIAARTLSSSATICPTPTAFPFSNNNTLSDADIALPNVHAVNPFSYQFPDPVPFSSTPLNPFTANTASYGCIFGSQDDFYRPYSLATPSTPSLPHIEQLSNLPPPPFPSSQPQPTFVVSEEEPLDTFECFQSKKRKADEMDDEDDGNTHFETAGRIPAVCTLHYRSPRPATVSSTDTEASKCTPIHPEMENVELDVDIEQDAQVSDELMPDEGVSREANQLSLALELLHRHSSPHTSNKKVKLVHDEEPPNRGSGVKTVMKYAATALAGASVGAIGVVLGLASLPVDYFA